MPTAMVAQPASRSSRGSMAAERGILAVYPGKPMPMSDKKPMPTAWALRPVSSAARVGEHRAVTWNRL